MRIVAKCIRIKEIQTDIKRLRKKYLSVDKDIIYAERLLEAGTTLLETFPFPGFGGQHRLFKSRVIDTSSGKGKSSGYRLVYEEISDEKDTMLILILLYKKNDYSSEKKVVNEVKARLRGLDYSALT